MTIYCGLDIETTGLDPATDRITEIGLVLYRDSARVGQYGKRVNPEREVSAKAQQVTGLSWVMLKDEPVWSQIGKDVQAILNKVDVLIGHNIINFDWPFIQAEQSRIGLTLPDRQIVDTQSARWATGDGKVPSLKELCWSLGQEYDEVQAHSAIYDAELSLICYLRGKEYGFYQQ